MSYKKYWLLQIKNQIKINLKQTCLPYKNKFIFFIYYNAVYKSCYNNNYKQIQLNILQF